jgi:dienelactone hydrolase
MGEAMVPYEYDGRKFVGALVWDDSVSGTRPAIYMQPDWFGVCRHTMELASQCGGPGYLMMLADTYGEGYGEREKDEDELLANARGARLDLDFVLGCGAVARAALIAEAEKRGLIDTSRIGAIGFCMGGGIVLEEARAGADFRGTVVFHVTLPNPVGEPPKADYKGPAMAIHGAADPVTPKEMMDKLEAEWTAAGIQWQVVNIGHAVHAFCVEGANHPGRSLYDPVVAQRAYKLMHDFFAEVFDGPQAAAA